jgi:hypothetical protein
MLESDRQPPQAWNSNTTWPQQQNADWLPSYGGSDIGSHMSYALTDLFEVVGGNVNMADVGNRDQDGFMRTQHPLENNGTVSRLLGDLISCDHPQYV